MDAMRRIDLDVERLVVEGASPAEARRIGAAVEAELTRLLAERGLPPGLEGGGEIGALDAGPVPRAPGDSARAVGGRVAGAVARSLGKGGSG